MTPTLRDQIAGMRAEIKAHRVHTQRIREGIRSARARKDWIGALTATAALNNRLRMIRDRELLIKELKAQQVAA